MNAPGSDAILARLLALHPKVIDLSLGRMERLLAALGHPERRLPPVVHIAGTNGKGSTQAMIRAGLEANGASVHAYTSPHLARFHERIRLSGELIAENRLAALLEECEAVNDGQPITFFEITTAAAFLAFSRVPADWLLLEVGLGGRLDATNVIDDPRLTIITPISPDHQQWLGDGLDQIAGEKAGILKRGVPCVVAPQAPEALKVIEDRAARLGAPLLASGQHWDAREEAGRLVYEDEAGLLDLPRPRLPGGHQIDNAGAATCALRALGASEAACAAAMTEAHWPARLQRLKAGPLVDIAQAEGLELWLDGGHNIAAGLVAAHWLSEMQERAPAPVALIAGMLEAKDSAAYLRAFAGLAAGVVCVDIPGASAGLPREKLAEAARCAGLAAATAPDAAQALRKAAALTGRGGRVLVCGSLYLAGSVLRANG